MKWIGEHRASNITNFGDNRVITSTDDLINPFLAETYFQFVNDSNVSELKLISNENTADHFRIRTSTNGATDIYAIDGSGGLANLIIGAQGTFELTSTGLMTLDSGAAINIEPASGSAILLDGTISIDAGVVTGATSITSTAFVGNITGNRTLAVSSSTDGDYDGDVVYFGGTEEMVIGAIYHYKSDATWELADADAAATADGLLGVALGAESNTHGVLLRGMVTLDHDPGAIGDVLYLSTTAGDCSATAPSGNTDIIRIIGYQVSHASNGNIWFNPDNTFVEVSA